MTLSVRDIEGRKIDGPLGGRQPERLAHRALGEDRDTRGVEPFSLAVERVQPDESFDPPRDHSHFLPGGLCPPHHFTRSLADERRAIEGPFTGDHQLRVRERGVDSYARQHPLRAGQELRLGEERESGAQPSRRTAARQRREVAAAVTRHQLAEALETAGEQLHALGTGALLRADPGPPPPRPPNPRPPTPPPHPAPSHPPAP